MSEPQAYRSLAQVKQELMDFEVSAEAGRIGLRVFRTQLLLLLEQAEDLLRGPDVRYAAWDAEFDQALAGAAEILEAAAILSRRVRLVLEKVQQVEAKEREGAS